MKGQSTLPALLRFTGAVDRDPAIMTWFAAQPSDHRVVAEAWFARMRRCGANVRELLHDGLPTVCVDDAPFAYVGVFRDHVNVGFFHGATLPDPAGLLEGTGKSMRHVKLRPSVPFEGPALEMLITAAYRDIVTRLALAE